MAKEKDDAWTAFKREIGALPKKPRPSEDEKSNEG